MKLHLFLFTLFGIFLGGSSSPLLAQGHGEQKKQKDPIKMLEEIQEKMAKAEDLLARSVAGSASGSSDKIDRTQKAVQRRLERLMEQGKSQDEIVKELDKFLERKKRQMKKTGKEMNQVIKEIDELLKSQKSQEKAVEEINKILQSSEQMKKASQSMDKIFQEVGEKHTEALGTIEKLIRMAQQSSSSSSQPMPMPEEKPQDQEEEKQDKEHKPKDPKNSDKKDPKNQKEMEKKPDDNIDKDKKNDADDNDRWGNLPARAREKFHGIEGRELPAKYRYRIEEYIKKLNEQKQR